MKVLLFQIYAPLVSWGDIAVGGERKSSRHPSKSAITGLISAALGIKRNKEELLRSFEKNLGIAVKMYAGGSVLKDFHTVQVPKSESKVTYHSRKAELSAPADKIGTILSRREYRCDALSVVAVILKDDKNKYSLEQIKEALQTPHYHLYYGRKSCVPALPLRPEIFEMPNIKEAFDHYITEFPSPIKESAKKWVKKIFSTYPGKILYENNVTYFWEEGMDSGLDTLQITERYDHFLSRKRWQFSARKEYMAVEKRLEV